MNAFPTRDVIERVRTQYRPGARVRLVSMDDPYTRLPEGIAGTVISVDDIATIHVRWDNGHCLGVVYGVDIIELEERE